MPDDHSKLVPLLPIPNRTVKRLSADDSAGSRVKVGHRQAITALRNPSLHRVGVFVPGSLFKDRDVWRFFELKNLQTFAKRHLVVLYCKASLIAAGFLK